MYSVWASGSISKCNGYYENIYIWLLVRMWAMKSVHWEFPVY